MAKKIDKRFVEDDPDTIKVELSRKTKEEIAKEQVSKHLRLWR